MLQVKNTEIRMGEMAGWHMSPGSGKICQNFLNGRQLANSATNKEAHVTNSNPAPNQALILAPGISCCDPWYQSVSVAKPRDPAYAGSHTVSRPEKKCSKEPFKSHKVRAYRSHFAICDFDPIARNWNSWLLGPSCASAARRSSDTASFDKPSETTPMTKTRTHVSAFILAERVSGGFLTINGQIRVGDDGRPDEIVIPAQPSQSRYPRAGVGPQARDQDGDAKEDGPLHQAVEIGRARIEGNRIECRITGTCVKEAAFHPVVQTAALQRKL